MKCNNWIAGLLGLGLLAAATAQAEDFQGMQVEVVGQGRPVLMVPGLNSGIDSWRETCLALQDVPVQCHLVQLPGFAGQPAQADVPADFVAAIERRLGDYIDQHMAARPVLAGHSLGGFFVLKLAASRPQQVGAVIAVDSLPFFPAAGNPAATVESSRAMADAMRQQMLTLDEASYRQQALGALNGMSKQETRQALLQQWGADSDRQTTAAAMHALMTSDLRPQLAQLHAPVLVLGAWEAYAGFGATKDSTGAIFQSQYAGLPDGRIAMADSGYHFLMWDAAPWLEGEIRRFLADYP